MTPFDAIPGRARSFAGFLDDLARTASDTPAQNWLRENGEAIRRAHAEMQVSVRPSIAKETFVERRHRDQCWAA